jgi:hypothetical protein
VLRSGSRVAGLRAVLARIQVTVGLGFASMVVGHVVAGIPGRALTRGGPLPHALQLLVFVLLGRFWLLAMLPGLAGLLARIVPLHPWKTALGAALTGELFLLVMEWGLGGLDVWTRRPLFLIARVVTLAAGVWLTAWAVRRGRRRAKGEVTAA